MRVYPNKGVELATHLAILAHNVSGARAILMLSELET